MPDPPPFPLTMPTDLPAVLAAWRTTHGMKISSAAATLGVSPAAWGHWENGSRFPNSTNLALLSAFTRLPLRALLCANYPRCPFHRTDADPCAGLPPAKTSCGQA